ncbi:hypothetical protein [Deinococcus aquiradiocola]|uniref:Uncharacterized protein n=1 Tax=Deinococcus aquiradiocola TaxID=393059 RepID=A0A917P7H0_9DEIO|nr:hypothetical protein [Deinococcus aquiradiocola]GGJ65512.1 hypothetical protein GCM10008939_06850 [Deinococcus aquiradiocola]
MTLTLRACIEQLLELEEELDTDHVTLTTITQPNYPMIAHPRGLAWTRHDDGTVTVYLQLAGNSDYAPHTFDDERHLTLTDGRPA